MTMSDHKINVVQKIMRQQRMEYKRKENLSKPPLCADDVVKTTDFIFSAPFEREGDSGKLLLAKRKADRSDKYFVKHAFADCACNLLHFVCSFRELHDFSCLQQGIDACQCCACESNPE